jgi:archaemetzincin
MKNLVPIFLLLIAACNSNSGSNKPTSKTSNETRIIYIQPLGEVKTQYTNTVKLAVENFYGFKCVIRKAIPLTKDILANSKKRYEASKILKKFNAKENIFLLMEKDIAWKDTAHKSDEYGIIGLGNRPGTVCVVSTHRLKGNASEQKVIERLEKTALHEIGHNLGLSHCDKTPKCMMNDEKGTIQTTDKESVYLCPSCRKSIGI